jgi:outer membrane protein OmpA-like peptidoglycan-associated protein
MRTLTLLLTVVVCLAGCAKREVSSSETTPPQSTASSETATTTATATTTSTAAVAAAAQRDLLAFSAGALVAQKAEEYGGGWTTFWLIDERSDTGWASPENKVTPQTVVIALPERTQLDRLEFDTANVDGDDRAAKDVSVEMSDKSATDGFTKIADVTLAAKQDGQSFPTSAPVAGRWLRLVMKSNHGSKHYMELMEVRGFGKQLSQTAFQNASGTYETNYGNFHLRQEGTSVTGCYEHDGGLLNGGIEGRVMKFTWREEGGESDRGPALMVFSPDGKDMFGLWWTEGQTDRAGGTWDGKKISSDVGSCPHWAGTGAEAQIAKDLQEQGRSRIYGINFDLDSDHLRDESKPTLDKIVAMLKSKSDWKLKIEGHTDSTGNEAHNQQLSEARAAAVKSYLVAAGIDASRLSSAGLGASKPVAGNESETGRAQNRRVEVVKE